MTTINKGEIQKFSKLAEEWWDVNGKFKPLHKFNPIRIKYILDNIYKKFGINASSATPLKNLDILDIGCGGGLVSEPMATLGAKVTGIDASEKNIKVAKIHAEKKGLNINYEQNSPENLKINKKYDVILNLEIIEHVEDIKLFLKSCSNLIDDNGIMFIATINRTFTSYVKAIVGAEYILRWLPIGTHNWQKLVKPEELEKELGLNGLMITNLSGMHYNILSDKWIKSKNYDVNYIAAIEKN